MASTDKPTSPPKAAPELESGKAVASPPKSAVPPPPPPRKGGRVGSFVDVVLRISVFATTLVAVVVMVTSSQTELVPYPLNPLIRVPVKAKFSDSPAFIYFIAALSVACLYSIITTLASFSVICKPAYRTKFLLHFALLDVIVLGLVASATGAAAGVAYIGLKGNSHVNWAKICNRYNTFCLHLGSSIAVSLVASVLLVFLVCFSIISLHRRISH